MSPLFAPLFAAGALLLALAVARLAQARQRRRLLDGVALGEPGGEPEVLFFTGAWCTVCHTAQRPALERLRRRLGGQLRVREVDVADRPDLARHFGVLTLPTTIVVDAGGRAVAVNTGFAPEEQLARQLAAAGGPLAR